MNNAAYEKNGKRTKLNGCQTCKQQKRLFKIDIPTKLYVTQNAPRKRCPNTEFFCGSYFLAFGLNTDQKNTDTQVFGHFSRSDMSKYEDYRLKITICLSKDYRLTR